MFDVDSITWFHVSVYIFLINFNWFSLSVGVTILIANFYR